MEWKKYCSGNFLIMREARREEAMRVAHAKFIQDMRVSGFGDAIAKAKPYNECQVGSGQLIIPIEGIRNSSGLQKAMEKAGYGHDVRNNAFSDAPEFVALVPFVREDNSGVDYYGHSKRKSRGKFLTPSKLILVLLLLVAFGLTQTPPRTWHQIFG